MGIFAPVRLVLAALVLLLAATACGGDSEDRLSPEAFRQEANAICDEYEGRISELGAPSSPEEVPNYVDQVVPLIDDALAELRALNPPEELEDDYNVMLDQTAQGLAAARDLGEAAADQDAGAVQDALEEGQRAEEESDRIATRLGLDSCAE
jgi:hypothetical protein